MRKRTLAAMLAVGVVGAMLATPTQAVARLDDTTRAGAKQVDIVPLTAVEHVTRTVRGADGALRTTRETNRLYRDGAGRTRHESGSTVTINDPATRTTVSLDTAARTYTRSVAPQAPGADAPKPDEQQVASAPKDLGTAVVGGVRAEGKAYTLTLEREKEAPLTKDATVWIAKDIQLDVSMRVVEPSGEGYSKTYTDIRTGVEPAESLFAVPGGYRTADRTTSGNRVACPLDIGPDPLVLVSYGLLVLGSGIQRGVTDFANAACVIGDSVAVVQSPLWAAPVTPLGLPYFDWFFYDNGDPFVPCNSVWFGSAGFLAFNATDATTKWSVVALYVYC